jgi:putative transposase
LKEIDTMTVPTSIDPALPWIEQIDRAEPDLLRAMLETFVQALMGAEADAICGAPFGARTDERVNTRNGYRPREWDTGAGTIELAIPKLRSGSYYPDWLLERRKRAERALTTVVATCYLLGVSTRRMEKLVETLGITRLSKSQVSVMAKELDEHVESFRTRPLDAGPYTFIAADALVLKVREGGRVLNVHALLATGVNADRHREILGLEVTSGEDGAGWLAFFRNLVARALTGTMLVTSDATPGWSRRSARPCPARAGSAAARTRGEPDEHHAQEQLAAGPHAAAQRLRPARPRRRQCPVRPRPGRAERQAPRRRGAPGRRPRRRARLQHFPKEI